MPQASQRWLHLLRHFVVRDLRQRYLGSLWGGAWALLQPLLTLAIYAVVFVEVLKVRLPEAAGPGFVPFFAAALWPWTAFARITELRCVSGRGGLADNGSRPCN